MTAPLLLGSSNTLPPASQYMGDSEEQLRWMWTSLAWRLIYGRWQPDLESRTKILVGSQRSEAWRQVDLSANLYRVVWDAIATQYTRPPTVEHDDPAGLELAGRVAASGYWQLMQRVQRDTLALREMLVRWDAPPRRGVPGEFDLVQRAVTPDVVTATADVDRPDEMVAIQEMRQRYDGATRQWVWTCDELSIADLAQPTYRVLSHDSRDLTAQELGAEQSGAAYEYRRSDGVPVLPYVLYHAQRTGRLWDSFSVLELVEGTLNLGVYYSLFGHVLRKASWRDRYTVDLNVGGVAPEGEDGKLQSVVTDPATVTQFFTDANAQGQPQIGSFDLPVDPLAMIEAIGAYERRLVSYAGINAADQIRMSGDPRSGYAVSVSRDAQREAQRKYEPQFRAGDIQSLELAAVLLNRAYGEQRYPETGYRITYEGVPYSAEEQRGQREQVEGLRREGLMSRVQAYQAMHPGASPEDAKRALLAIAESDRELESLTKPPAPTLPAAPPMPPGDTHA